MNILVTSTSFLDTPGKHHDLLNSKGYKIEFLRGPLVESDIYNVIHKYDGIVCGDDEYTEKVLKKGAESKVKIISKYGVGLDKINLKSAGKLGIEVRNCKGVNHSTVAEHVFTLLLSYSKNMHLHLKKGWERKTGFEIKGKSIGIVGLGNIGKAVARIANAFEMNVLGFDKIYDESFLSKNSIKKCQSINELVEESDIITLHLNLNKSTKHIINKELLNFFNQTKILINTARSNLVDLEALLEKLESNKIGAYLTDVLDFEPMVEDHPLKKFSNVYITPHVSSRTKENVEKQGLMAVQNLFNFFDQRPFN